MRMLMMMTPCSLIAAPEKQLVVSSISPLSFVNYLASQVALLNWLALVSQLIILT